MADNVIDVTSHVTYSLSLPPGDAKEEQDQENEHHQYHYDDGCYLSWREREKLLALHLEGSSVSLDAVTTCAVESDVCVVEKMWFISYTFRKS